MKLSTKTLASLMLVTTVAAAVPGASRLMARGKYKESKFDRILQHHDRKGELRADVLGIDPMEFRDQLHRQSFEAIRKRQGFSTDRAFRMALLGKLRSELKNRGWSKQRMDNYVSTRSSRVV
jgi:hypothetical protein